MGWDSCRFEESRCVCACVCVGWGWGGLRLDFEGLQMGGRMS